MLSEKDTLLLWRFADGECSPEEVASLTERLRREPGLAAAWAEIRQLQASLRAVEAEQPSMRFTKNVLEKLPPVTQRLKRVRLLPKSVLWRWAAGFSLLIGLSFIFLPGAAVETTGPLVSALQGYQEELRQPLGLWQRLDHGWILAVSLAFLLLFSLDTFFLKRLRRREG